MVLVHKTLAVASCTVCLASAFIGSPQRAPTTAGRGGGYHHRRDSPLSGVSSIVSGSSRRRDAAAAPRLLLSSRTVDVDVIDVTDVTEEEARREKEQVPLNVSPPLVVVPVTERLKNIELDIFGCLMKRT